MYGVAFTQQCDNDLVGILLFKKEAKAKMAYRVMCGMEELSSLDPFVNSILETSDFDEIPEVEEVDGEYISIELGGKQQLIPLINGGESDTIPDIE